MSPPTLRFVLGHRPHALPDVAPDRTLLDVLREDLRCTAVKEGCASGDCGACTVAVAEAEEGGRLHWRAINSCIRLAHSVEGMAVFTAEDIAGEGGRLHPAQRAMLECHGSQCGFCTPGFVMSLFTLHRQRDGAAVSRGDALHALSGNLCRCTGYRPILDAAQTMHHWPDVPLDESGLLQQLKLLAQGGRAPVADSASSFYATPTTLAELLRLRAAYPQALIAAGTTDVGLWVTKQHRRFGQIIDVTRVTELRRIERGAHSLSIGAAASLTEAFDALAECRPQLKPFFDRFAGLPVRESGTLGGNVANGSPIGDSMPLLIALRAQVVLASTRGERTLALEDLYTGYRQNAMAPDELLVHILVPRPADTERLAVYKVSKRFDDDISAVCLALNLDIVGGTVQRARIGAGGVAATPARARQTEAALTGQPWTEATAKHAAAVLQAEFSPISDMRASGAYRSAVLGNLLQRYWLESQGQQAASLEDLDLESVA